nr:MAG TPA: hypothetical protein [Caudoviricetes sp.]
MSAIDQIIAMPDLPSESILCYLYDVSGNSIGMISTVWDEGGTSRLVSKIRRLDTLPGYEWVTPSIVLATELHALGENAVLDTPP